MFTNKKTKIGLLSILVLVVVLGGVLFLQKNNMLFKADSVNKEPGKEEIEVSDPQAPTDNELLVKFKSTATKEKKDKFLAKHGAKIKDSIDQIGVDVLSVPTPNSPEEKAKEIRKQDSDDIEFVEPNGSYQLMTIPNDPWFANWQGGPKQINMPQAWDVTTGSSSVKIAIVDTGVDSTHEDLQGRVLPGYDFYSNDNDAMDENHHGTHVAGIIGAVTNNAKGIAGITWENPILPIKVAGAQTLLSHSNIAKGLTYATDQGAKVINMSFGGDTSSTMKSAVDYAYGKGVVLAAAAGNKTLGGPETMSVVYPAAYPNVLAVGAADGWNLTSSTSATGPELDVLAPDVSLSTCLLNRYENLGGTSMSAGYVSGLAGLILSVNPLLTPAQVMDIIRNGAKDVYTAGFDSMSGYGVIDAYKSLTLAGGTGGTPPPPPAPTKGILSGKVTESGTSIPVVGSTVMVKQSGIVKSTSVTSSDGSYSFSLDAGTYDLTFSAANYTSQTKTGVVISSGTTTLANVALSLVPAPDTTVPTVSISTPTAGSTATLGSKVVINATASDNTAVSKVEFYVNGALKSTDTASPYSYSWNATGKGVAAGTYTITAKAYDAAGNISVSTTTINLIKATTRK